ncbi:MAG: hypothetical protein ACRC3H_11555 [Lachnospiraceae bacterium]
MICISENKLQPAIFGYYEERTPDSNAPVIGLVVTVTEDERQDDVFRSIKEHAQESSYEIMSIQAERSKEAQEANIPVITATGWWKRLVE